MSNNEYSIINKQAYLEHTYSDKIAPPSEYPNLLAKWLLTTVYKKTGTITDFGCGRGDYLSAFSELGFKPYGLDASPSINDLLDYNVKQVDFEHDDIPYVDEKFDFAFSKSVVEHLHKPSLYLSAIHQSLKTGGKAVIMTPSWEHTYWGPFYIDHTHVTPFTAKSLESALEMTGFKKVTVRYFYQLPLLWKFPWLRIIAKLIAKLPIPYSPYNNVPWKVSNRLNKLIRFSKEVMLIATVEK